MGPLITVWDYKWFAFPPNGDFQSNPFKWLHLNNFLRHKVVRSILQQFINRTRLWRMTVKGECRNVYQINLKPATIGCCLGIIASGAQKNRRKSTTSNCLVVYQKTSSSTKLYPLNVNIHHLSTCHSDWAAQQRNIPVTSTRLLWSWNEASHAVSAALSAVMPCFVSSFTQRRLKT